MFFIVSACDPSPLLSSPLRTSAPELFAMICDMLGTTLSNLCKRSEVRWGRVGWVGGHDDSDEMRS